MVIDCSPPIHPVLDMSESESRATRQYFANVFGPNPDLIRLQEIFVYSIDAPDSHSKSRLFRAHTREISFVIKFASSNSETRCMQLIEQECIWTSCTAPVFGIAWYETTITPTRAERKKCKWLPNFGKISIRFFEGYTLTMHQYITEHIVGVMEVEIVRSMAALLIHGLYYLGQKLPDFRHGDLHLGNIMIQSFAGWVYSHDIPEYIQINIPGITLYVPYFGMMPRIIDFDYAESKSLNITPADPDRRPISIVDSDLMRFLYSLFHVGPASIQAFVQSIGSWTQHFREQNEKSIRQAIHPVPSAADCLSSPAFSQYRLVPQVGVIIRHYGTI